MIVDLDTYDGDGRIACDLCIAGAGAAGITIARQFVGRGLKVVLAESGGLDFDEATQDLYKGRLTGLGYYDLEETRLRFFGGSTNHWAGWCAPLEPSDFARREWVPHSGWPIGRPELDPYYARAHELLELGPVDYAGQGGPLAQLSAEHLRTAVWRNSTVQHGVKFADELKAASDVTVLLQANLVRILGENGKAVTGYEVASLAGKRARIEARSYVLALGGIENPRLLLASNVGNQNDLVGRFFMDHPYAFGAVLARVGAKDWPLRHAEFERDGVTMREGLYLSEAAQRREGALKFSATFQLVRGEHKTTSRGFSSVVKLRDGLKAGKVPSDWLSHVGVALSDLDGTVLGWYEGRGGAERDVWALVTRSEQAPNPESRITLDGERDALGVPRLRVDWRLNDQDRRTITAGHQAIARELGRLGLGRVRITDWAADESIGWERLAGGFVSPVQGAHHHMGTTRMADDPKQGVVDRDCRVHGIDNLFVAGSSVFPTGGFYNPTLTIVALSLRLADRLRDGIL